MIYFSSTKQVALAAFMASFLVFIMPATQSVAAEANAPEQKTTEAQTIETEDGTTNPEELSLKYYVKNLERNIGRGHDFACSLGYMATKAGDHKDALKIFRTCSDHGNKGTKIWLSYMHQNGFGVPKSLEKATEWLKKSADEGYSIGEYNFGLALIKGEGIERNFKLGKQLIDKAASEGDIHAIELQKSNYDPDVVTPDADQKDKKPAF